MMYIIYNNENEIGKVLIDNITFALIKYLDKSFNEKVNFKTKFASINVRNLIDKMKKKERYYNFNFNYWDFCF